MRRPNSSLSLSRICAALLIMAARAAKVSLRNIGKVTAAQRSLASICASESGSKLLRSSPVAGLMVAMAMKPSVYQHRRGGRRRLFPAQSDDWIDLQRSSRRQEAGQQRNDRHREEHQAEG